MSIPIQQNLALSGANTLKVEQNTQLGEGSGQSFRHVSSTTSRHPIYSGTGTEEQYQITYSDAYGIKTTRFFRTGLYKYYVRTIENNKGHIHSLKKRISKFELWLTPENMIERTVIETVTF